MSTNEKVRSVLEHQTDQEEKSFSTSIPQGPSAKHLAIEIEPMKHRDPIALDSFVGNVRSFKLYLNAMRTLLNAGIIVP